MIGYFIGLLKNLKKKESFNVIESFKGSKIEVSIIENAKYNLEKEKSKKTDNGYIQHFGKHVSILWEQINGEKHIKEITTHLYKLIVGLKSFIVKVFGQDITDLRFDKSNGKIVKINFKKYFFISSLDFKKGKAILSTGLNLKEMFNKSKISELTEDEWEIIKINSIV